MSSYVIIPALLINYINFIFGSDIECVLAEEMYDSLENMFDLGNNHEVRKTAKLEQSIFMRQCIRNGATSKPKGPIEINGLPIDYDNSIFIYVRFKGSIIRSCPSLEHLNTVISESLKYSSTVFVSGDIDSLSIPEDKRVINVGSIKDHKILKICLPINCKYNISLAIGGGTHLPVLFKKPMLTVVTYIGLIYPYSITLPGSIKVQKRNDSTDRISTYIDLSKTLYAKGESHQLALF